MISKHIFGDNIFKQAWANFSTELNDFNWFETIHFYLLFFFFSLYTVKCKNSSISAIRNNSV